MSAFNSTLENHGIIAQTIIKINHFLFIETTTQYVSQWEVPVANRPVTTVPVLENLSTENQYWQDAFLH